MSFCTMIMMQLSSVFSHLFPTPKVLYTFCFFFSPLIFNKMEHPVGDVFFLEYSTIVRVPCRNRIVRAELLKCLAQSFC